MSDAWKLSCRICEGGCCATMECHQRRFGGFTGPAISANGSVDGQLQDYAKSKGT